MLAIVANGVATCKNISCGKFKGVLLGNVLARRVPVSGFWRYRVSLQRKKCCQQIVRLDDKSFSIAVCIDAIKKSVLREMHAGRNKGAGKFNIC